jgi:hypothetical protein
MRRIFGHTAGIFIIGEDLPDERNRVELDPEEKDSDGVPAARVTYGNNDNSRKMLDHGAARAREVLEAAGAIDIQDGGIILLGFSFDGHRTNGN